MLLSSGKKEGLLMFKNKYGEIRSGWAIVPLLLLIIVGMGIAQGLTLDEYNSWNQIIVTGIYGVLTIGGCLLLFKLFYGRGFK